MTNAIADTKADISQADSGRGFALALLCAAQFMVVLDTVIINVALDSIKSQLHFSPQNLQWVVNAYTLAFGGFLLLGGRAADLLGRRRIFVAGLTLFSLASLAGGLAPTQETLIIARAFQGLGGAMVSPAALSLLTTLFPEGAARNRALGVWGATAAAGAASGVLLGGLLTNFLGWRWALFINVPIGLCVSLLSFKLLQESRAEAKPGAAGDGRGASGFDVSGAALVTAGLVVLVYGVVGAADAGWASPRTLGLFAAGLALFAAFYVVERRSAAPLVDFALFRRPGIAGANLVALTHATGPIGTLYFLSLYMQQVLRLSPLMTGLAFLPFALMAALSSGFSARAVQRFGVKASVISGLLLMASGLLLFARLPTDSAAHYVWDLLPGLLLVGAGITLAGVPMTIAAMTGVDEADSGLASGLVNTSQQIGAALTLAILVTAAAVSARSASDAYASAFYTGATVLCIGAVIAASLLPKRAAQTSQSTDQKTKVRTI